MKFMENINNTVFDQRFTVKNPLISPRFYLCDLTLTDVSDRYLAWMNDSVVREFIQSSYKTNTKNDLLNYLEVRMNKDCVRFFGIFSKETNHHIGNIKYEPIDLKNRFAVMGVLIGDKLFRGSGVFGEVYSVSSRYLALAYGIRKIYAGVDKGNLPAIKSYKKNGFEIVENSPLAKSAENLMLCNVIQR